MLIRKVEVDTAFTLGEPDVDRSRGPIELPRASRRFRAELTSPALGALPVAS
jgi:hypothetical protein